MEVYMLFLCTAALACTFALAQEQPGNIAEVASEKGFTILVDFVVKAGLADVLTSQGPFTVFAPTNEAFKALDPATVTALEGDPDLLKEVLLYHVVPGKVYSSDLADGDVESAQGQALAIKVNPDQTPAVTVNGVGVQLADVEATNGVIHVIDQVLLLPEKRKTAQPGNLAEVASSNGFTTLVDFILKAGLGDTITNGGPFTVFAPTNDAFALLDKATVDALSADTELLKKVLLYHVVPGRVYSSDLADGALVDSVEGGALRIDIYADRDNAVTVNDVLVSGTDVEASNGVVHVLEEVLLPPGLDKRPNIAEVASAEGFTTLVDFVVKAGLAETLSTGGPFTVFAPTNKAFEALSKASVDKLTSDPAYLKAVLLYHVVPQKIFAKSLTNEATVPTVEGSSLRVNLYPGVTTVNGVGIVATDVQAKNGLIHVVDQILLPPEGDVVEVLSMNPDFSTLVTAVKAAGLVETLKSQGPFTVFAPNNYAFERLAEGMLAKLLDDPVLLGNVLKRHVLNKTLYSAGISSTSQASSVNGDILGIGSCHHGTTVRSKKGSAKIIKTDLVARNGVIHILDRVI